MPPLTYDPRLEGPWSLANTPLLARNPRKGHKQHPSITVPHYWTGEPLEVTRPERRRGANGYVLYDGPSRFDGKPIVVIATGFRDPTDNIKTGPMIQTWIIRKDIDPQEAVYAGEDSSICGKCAHRGNVVNELRKFMTKRGKRSKTKKMMPRSEGRSCYVVVVQAPRAVWDAYHRGVYPKVEEAGIADLFAGSFPPRIGSYGDPLAVPVRIWRKVLKKAVVWTGYTAAWKTRGAAAYKEFLMASVSSIKEQREAVKRGWRTFRVGRKSEPLIAGTEVICPASPEGGYKVTCDSCSLCMGAAKNAKSVVIAPHGSGARFHEERGGRHLPTIGNPDDEHPLDKHLRRAARYGQKPEVDTGPVTSWESRPPPPPTPRHEPVVLISCTVLKHQQPMAAKDIYISRVFNASRQYAEQSGLPWGILSAKHGVLHPDEVIEPYDQKVPTEKYAKRALALRIANTLHNKFPGHSRAIVLAGEKYVQLLPPYGFEYALPLRGLGSGARWNRLKVMIAEQGDEPPEAPVQRTLFNPGPDERIRELERRAQESGAPEDMARWGKAMQKASMANDRKGMTWVMDGSPEWNRMWSMLHDAYSQAGLPADELSGWQYMGTVNWGGSDGAWHVAHQFRNRGDTVPGGLRRRADVHASWCPTSRDAVEIWVKGRDSLGYGPVEIREWPKNQGLRLKNPGHDHPRLKYPVPRDAVEEELHQLHAQAGLEGYPIISWPHALTRLHEDNTRRYAQVFAGGGDPEVGGRGQPRYELAEQVRWLPASHRTGLLAHEVGHVLDPKGGEDGADMAARRRLGIEISYDDRWPGKGLQHAKRRRKR